MVKLIEKGNIFKIEGVTSYAHGCNCAGAMGKGIALQFRAKFPDMYRIYKQMCKSGRFNLGDVYDYDYGGGHVYNLGTQKSWGPCAKLRYIEESVRKMCELAIADNIDAIALPAIGAGLGGLNWDDVKRTITKVGNEFPQLTLYVVEKYAG